MKLTVSLKTAGRFAGAMVAAAGLLATVSTHKAAAGDVNPCAADRPCITELFISPNSVLSARWFGSWDAYNIRWENPALVRDADVGDAHTDGITVLESAWNRTYRFSVQGCNRRFLAPSVCTSFAASEIALKAPAAPQNVRLSGDTVTFDRLDSLAFHAELRGIQSADGTDVYITHRAADTARSIALPAGWRDRFSAVKICARNPAGASCTDVPTRIIAAPQPAPKLPPAPATPANFKGERDGGFGTRILLTWSDSSSEEYYYLTAFSVQGEVPQQLDAPAPKLGANSTVFVVTGDRAALVGGIEFHLQACNAGGCSAPAKVVVQ